MFPLIGYNSYYSSNLWGDWNTLNAIQSVCNRAGSSVYPDYFYNYPQYAGLFQTGWRTPSLFSNYLFAPDYAWLGFSAAEAAYNAEYWANMSSLWRDMQYRLSMIASAPPALV